MTVVIDPSTVLVRNPSVLFNDFDDGIIMMDIDSGHYFDVDSIGARIWALLDQPKSLASLCDLLVEEFDIDAATCVEQTTEFASDLLARDLIRKA